MNYYIGVTGEFNEDINTSNDLIRYSSNLVVNTSNDLALHINNTSNDLGRHINNTSNDSNGTKPEPNYWKRLVPDVPVITSALSDSE